MSQAETMAIIRFIWAGWPHLAIEPDTIAHFHAVLGMHDFVDVQKSAVIAISKDRQHPPGAGEIKQIVKDEARKAIAVRLSLPEPIGTPNLEMVEELKKKFPEVFE